MVGMQNTEAVEEQGQEPPLGVAWTEAVLYMVQAAEVLELGQQERQATEVLGVHIRLAVEPLD